MVLNDIKSLAELRGDENAEFRRCLVVGEYFCGTLREITFHFCVSC